MDSFESVVATILERKGYWVKPSFKVNLSKEEKRAIGRPSSPRWELDLVVYKGLNNEVLVVERKSYLDSPGVRFRSFEDSDQESSDRYKLFNDQNLRTIVFRRLSFQLEESGLCSSSPKITLALAAGKIKTESDRMKIQQHFQRNSWLLFDENWLKENLESISNDGYENAITAVVSKLILR
jgi:hypothetical protein